MWRQSLIRDDLARLQIGTARSVIEARFFHLATAFGLIP
jgi:hypothetical protein